MIALVAVLTGATPVSVSMSGCAFVAEEVRRITELELIRGPPRPLPVTLSCDARSLMVTVDDPVTGKTLSRSFPKSEVPERGGERYAAIAISELVEASWSELLLPSPELAPAAKVTSEERSAAVETLPTRRVRLSAMANGRGYFNSGVVQWGGGVRAAVQLLGPFEVVADVLAESGRTTVTGGSVSADDVAGGLFAALRLELGRVGLLGALGGRIAGARLVGFPDDTATFEGRTVTGLLLGPAALGEVSVSLGAVVLSLAVESGVLLRGMEGRSDGSRVTGLWGGWLAGTFGIGWRW